MLAWDSVLDYQRLLLAVVATSVMLHELHQLLLVVLLMGTYLLLVVLVRPWENPVVTWLQVGGSSVLVGSTLGVTACTVGFTDATTAFASPYKQVIPSVIIAANGLYLLVALLCCFFYLHEDRKLLRGTWHANRYRVCLACCGACMSCVVEIATGDRPG